MGVIVTLPESEEHSISEFLENRRTFINVSGVYVLWGAQRECLYVGKSSSLGRRVFEHTHGKGDSIRFYREIVDVTLYCAANMFYVDVYETHLINDLRPKYNRDKMFFTEHTVEVSEQLERIEDKLHQLEEERQWLMIEIDEFDRFKEDEYHDERVVRFEWVELLRQLRELDRNIQRTAERRALYRRRLTLSGGAC
ncbi:GIY-YIG nuclease family protein [Paenibacillus sp. 7124]|uniref:GIY-YIG nuclease family protein n=1 Tax=Paenibacillus apii TaxID=1850370 RepID=A0A6M1PFT6_9BACL|nr:GIY-YIG nuclease family protein [Paenibacillus apii]NGM81208.1 GIY-YIG nuclease family protein [Paenibacillus apii]